VKGESTQIRMQELERAAAFASVELDAASKAWAVALGKKFVVANPQAQRCAVEELAKSLQGRWACVRVRLKGDRSGDSSLLLRESDVLAMVALVSMLDAEATSEKLRGRLSQPDKGVVRELAERFAGAAETAVADQFGETDRYEAGEVVVVEPAVESEALKMALGAREGVAVFFQSSLEGFEPSDVARFYDADLSEHFTPTPKPLVATQIVSPETRKLLDDLAREIPSQESEETHIQEPEEPTELERLLSVELPVSVTLAGKSMTIAEILGLVPGEVLEFRRRADQPVDLLVAGRKIAEGDVVTRGGRFALEVRKVASVTDRARSLG